MLKYTRKEIHACVIEGSANVVCSEKIVVEGEKLQPHVLSTGPYNASSVISTKYTKEIGGLTIAITDLKILTPQTC